MGKNQTYGVCCIHAPILKAERGAPEATSANIRLLAPVAALPPT